MAIERICVVGGGVIGSLYAGHLARIARGQRPHPPRGARSRAHSGGPADLGQVRISPPPSTRRPDPGELPDFDLGILATKATQLEEAAAALAGRFPGATLMTIQNGLGAEELVRTHGDWPLLSAVTFMSGVRHRDTHVEYELDTETWLGPFAGTATYEQAHEVEALLVAVGAPSTRLPRSAAGAVVEADLQRDRQHGRRAHRPAARERVRRRKSSRPTSATSSTT